MSGGFYQTMRPVDASYCDQLVIKIAMPHGSAELAKRIKCGIIFVLGACGIQHCGNSDPAEALKHNQNQGEQE